MGDEMFFAKGNLSEIWAELFLKLMSRGVNELSPVLIQVNKFDDGVAVEDEYIRGAIDGHLRQLGKASCREVSNTIFPSSMWNKGIENNAEQLFERYDRIWPVIKKSNTANRKGVYFRRLTAFEPRDTNGTPVNQLKHIIDTFQSENHRRSALQAAIFDPTRDHSNSRQLGFPCLDHVGFTPIGAEGLCVTGYYTMQYVFEKAYGNYLGLCNLGRFMASQFGREMVQMNCFTTVAQKGATTKLKLASIEDDLRCYLDEKKETP